MEHKGTKTLTTERLILRQFRPEDANAMFRNWAADPEVTRFLTWPSHKDSQMTAKLLQSWIDRYDDPAWYNWGIELKENHELIGNISAVTVDERTNSADIGYCMGKAWWGNGIMPEALRAVIAFFFTEVGFERISACHDPNNPKSGRVMAKAGMKTDGILRAAGRNNQGICDVVYHSILRDEFRPCHNSACAGTIVRFARQEDLGRVNELRKAVNDIHVNGRPDIFKAGFPDELRQYIDEIWAADNKEIIVAERDGDICGFACVHFVERPENPYMHARKLYEIDELGIDEKYRRQGIATELIAFIRADAKKRNFHKIELNMWEFNKGALAFYESIGFRTYRRYLELTLDS